jgi:hypothetical protein
MKATLAETHTTRATRAAVAMGSAQEPPVAVLWNDEIVTVCVVPSRGAVHETLRAPDSVVLS